MARKILGYKDAKRYQQILDEIERCAPETIMEIGTWNGVRATEMIQAAQRALPGSTISYFGFDLFDNFPGIAIGRLFQHDRRRGLSI